MFRVEKTIEFDSAHRVPSREATSLAPHFHRYRVTVRVQGHLLKSPGNRADGMVIDFADLSDLMKTRIGVLAGKTLLWEDDPIPDGAIGERGILVPFYLPFIPTAELLAQWCYEQLAEIETDDRWISEVEVAVLGGGDGLRDNYLVVSHDVPDGERTTSIATYIP